MGTQTPAGVEQAMEADLNYIKSVFKISTESRAERASHDADELVTLAKFGVYI